MTDQLIAPVIPPANGPAHHRPGRPGRPGASPLPLASPPPTAQAPGGVVYGMGRIDASGRVTDRAITRVLGWHGGDRLTVTASAGVVIVRRDPAGMITLPARPCIAIPAAYSFAVVDHAIRAHGALPSCEGSHP